MAELDFKPEWSPYIHSPPTEPVTQGLPASLCGDPGWEKVGVQAFFPSNPESLLLQKEENSGHGSHQMFTNQGHFWAWQVLWIGRKNWRDFVRREVLWIRLWHLTSCVSLGQFLDRWCHHYQNSSRNNDGWHFLSNYYCARHFMHVDIINEVDTDVPILSHFTGVAFFTNRRQDPPPA